MKRKELIRLIESLGFALMRDKGSHILYKHPALEQLICISHGSKEVSMGVLRDIRKVVAMVPGVLVELKKNGQFDAKKVGA